MLQIIKRIIRAAKLDLTLYEEIKFDKTATRQAIFIVASCSSFLGVFLSIASRNLIFIPMYIISGLVSWYILTYCIYFVGTKFLKSSQTNVDHRSLLRTIGFSYSPGLIIFLFLIPGIELNLLILIVKIWMLSSLVIAVQNTFGYKNVGRAIGVCIIGWIVQIVFYIILGTLLFIVKKSSNKTPSKDLKLEDNRISIPG